MWVCTHDRDRTNDGYQDSTHALGRVALRVATVAAPMSINECIHRHDTESVRDRSSKRRLRGGVGVATNLNLLSTPNFGSARRLELLPVSGVGAMSMPSPMTCRKMLRTSSDFGVKAHTKAGEVKSAAKQLQSHRPRRLERMPLSSADFQAWMKASATVGIDGT